MNKYKKLCASLTLASCLVMPQIAKAQDIPFFATYPHIDLSRWFLSHGWANGEHQSCEWRSGAVTAHEQGIRLTLSDKGGQKRKIGCGEIQSKKRYKYGRYEARMRPAAGSGLNSAFFTYIGPPLGVPEHDEIDFEFLGKDKDIVEVNYHRNGKNMGPWKIKLGFDATADFHDYAFEWHPLKIIWYVDGKPVHETEDGADIPKNESKIFFSLWSGAPNVNDWLGPFKYTGPVNADVQWLKFTPLDQREQADKENRE